MEIKTRNTNTLMSRVYSMFTRPDLYIEQMSRNGPVRRIKEPVSIYLTAPWERVNFSTYRDANPFFHLMEALAMLCVTPLNNVAFMSYFAKNMASFSDDGLTYNAFYGTRARQWSSPPMALDQLAKVIITLQDDPESRQALVQLWDAEDLYRKTKDKACNLCMLFDIQEGKLCMTTFNRSNDAVLGSVCGANVVHLSLFQEYVASSLDLEMGGWWHISNNLHVYTDATKFPKTAVMLEHHADMTVKSPDAYCGPDGFTSIRPQKIFQSSLERDRFDHDLKKFLDVCMIYLHTGGLIDREQFTSYFIQNTAVPMFNSWQLHKKKETSVALMKCSDIHAGDWRLACTLWLQRRNRNIQSHD